MMTRRDFGKAVAAAAATVPVASGSPTTAWVVNRGNMWAPDLTSVETLARCNRLLATNPDDVLARVHRGSVPEIYFDRQQAAADLSRAISLEPANPCVWYIRGTCFDVAADLQEAISLLSMNGDATGEAICTSTPDYFEWRGTESGELLYLSLRELGFALAQRGHYDDAIAAYRNAARFEAISPTDLEAWADASFKVGSFCRAIVQYDRLIAIEPRDEFVRWRDECWAAITRRS